jgi:hypothetical protein
MAIRNARGNAMSITRGELGSTLPRETVRNLLVFLLYLDVIDVWDKATIEKWRSWNNVDRYIDRIEKK